MHQKDYYCVDSMNKVEINRQVDKQVDVLYPGAGEQCFSGPWLSCIGAESSHTAGVTVAVPHWYTHYTAHGHTSFLIYREKEREMGCTLTAAM